ncbi:UNVERIFIED_CONTAM: hypothetical protein GTU68_061254 [Idotea baltica]|nr:hypothetical protein [Idotea baltica]
MSTDFPAVSVTELTHQLKQLIEVTFPYVYVKGELSNVKRSRPGHVYLTLKDKDAQISGVIWRMNASRLKFELQDGLDVLVAGPVQLYPPRGDYQINIEEIVPLGLGPLEIAFRQLQEKLSAEGLFDPERKRSLPRIPKRIAIVTSPTSAAVRDMMQVISRRWRASDVVIVPVPVQGDGAAKKIATALDRVHLIPNVDVVITGRGGGSLEDLWAFNEEVVARAIFNCKVPVVSAVGHEVDVSIADLVADRRALTPSEAAELVVPDRHTVRSHLDSVSARLKNSLVGKAYQSRAILDSLSNRRVLTHPMEMLQERSRTLDSYGDSLERSIRQSVANGSNKVAQLVASLEALSPLKVLGRGYSLTQAGKSNDLVRSVDDVTQGQTIRTVVNDGTIESTVQQTVSKLHDNDGD